MKRYIFTESQVKKVINTTISEQSEERSLITRVQKFLNEIFKNDKTFKQLQVDGKTGPNSETEKGIQKLQSMLGIYPTDGVWGSNIEETMEQKRKDLYKVWQKHKPGFFNSMFQ